MIDYSQIGNTVNSSFSHEPVITVNKHHLSPQYMSSVLPSSLAPMGTEDIGNASKKTCPDMIRAVKNGLNRHIDDVRVSLLGAGAHDLSINSYGRPQIGI